MSQSKEVWGREYRVEVGTVIKPDNWQFGQRLERSEWDRAAFRLPSGRYPGVSTAVNVVITGRTLRRIGGSYWLRVLIEFVGDGEPSISHGGWMLA